MYLSSLHHLQAATKNKVGKKKTKKNMQMKFLHAQRLIFTVNNLINTTLFIYSVYDVVDTI